MDIKENMQKIYILFLRTNKVHIYIYIYMEIFYYGRIPGLNP